MANKPKSIPKKPRPDVMHSVEVRVREPDLVTLRAAAERAGLPLATWLRVVALAAAAPAPKAA